MHLMLGLVLLRNIIILFLVKDIISILIIFTLDVTLALPHHSWINKGRACLVKNDTSRSWQKVALHWILRDLWAFHLVVLALDI